MVDFDEFIYEDAPRMGTKTEVDSAVYELTIERRLSTRG